MQHLDNIGCSKPDASWGKQNMSVLEKEAQVTKRVSSKGLWDSHKKKNCKWLSHKRQREHSWGVSPIGWEVLGVNLGSVLTLLTPTVILGRSLYLSKPFASVIMYLL